MIKKKGKAKEKKTHKMERPGIEEEGKETYGQKLVETSAFEELDQLLLEHEWNFIKKRPEGTLNRRRSSTGSMVKTTLGVLLDNNNNSPRKLMSSLQHTIFSPPSEAVGWKVRTNDLAVEEILNERRAAIESGKLKGRRLFVEGDEGVTDQVNNGLQQEEITGLLQESEVRSVFSYEYSDNYEEENWGRKEGSGLSPTCPHCSYSYSSSSSLCADENVERSSGGLEVAILADHGRRRRRRWIMVWVAISLFVCIVGIILRNCFGIFEDDEEVFLTPT